MDYINRVADEQLKLKLDAFGATLIVGPKGCGKTTTAKQYANSFIEFQDEDERENYLLIANTHPSDLLKGAKPRLFDEWQDAPKIWGAIRKDIDDTGEVGQYILTGSSSANVDTPHTGTLRISRMKMYPMSLYESGESNGTVSLKGLFDNPDVFESCHSDLTIDDIKFAVCRGGWPGSLKGKNDNAKLAIAKDLFKQTCEVDISNIDGVKRNPKLARTILKSYSRNLCTLAETKTIIADVTATSDISKQTYYDYIAGLEKLMIIEDVEAWCPAIRSKTSIRSSKKRNIIDPSIAAAALGVSPEYFSIDYKTLGFLFECLCIRDLKIYSSAYNGQMSYYHDRYGLEADGVLNLDDGRFALIEVKLGQSEVDEGASHLCFCEHRCTCVSAEVRCVFHTELIHERRKVTVVVVSVLEMLTVFGVKKIFAVRTGLVPCLVEGEYLVCDRDLADPVLCLTCDHIEVLFLQIYIFLLQIKEFRDSASSKERILRKSKRDETVIGPKSSL